MLERLYGHGVHFNQFYIIRKTLKGRKQTNMEGGTERHLTKTDESVIRPMGEHR